MFRKLRISDVFFWSNYSAYPSTKTMLKDVMPPGRDHVERKIKAELKTKKIVVMCGRNNGPAKRFCAE